SCGFDAADRSDVALAALAGRFLADYERVYQYRAEEPIEMVNLRVVGSGRRPRRLEFDRVTLQSVDAGRAARRPVQFRRGAAPLDAPVIGRAALGEGMQGPVIVESYDSTVVVPPGWSAQSDRLGNIRLDRR